jgi:two-component system OmpR family response regulator
MRVLLAEDDATLAELIKAALSATGFVVEVERDGEVAFSRGGAEEFDAVLLDLGLPSLDGLTILKRWRKAGNTRPILILTARNQWEERVEAIEAGADDYLVKPFRMEELIARLRALLRRSNGFAASAVRFAGFVLDTRLLQLSRDGVPIELTPQEYKVLAYLAFHRGEVVSQLRLAEHIYARELERNSNTVEVLIGRLRRRVGNQIIKTKRGFGYYIETEA